jgi:hypothetical protein
VPESFNFDPRDLVRKPHKECPKCKHIAFGIVIVGSRDFHCRCADCGYRSRHTLPPVRKAVVYLDQLVISNLMLVRSNSEKTVDDFYKTLYAKLLKLLRLQAIACPFSDAHRNESVVHPSSPEPLRDSYEVFAHSISFKMFELIKYEQILNLVERLVSDEPSKVKPVTSRDVMQSDPDIWFDRIRVSVKPFFMDGQVDALKDWRGKTHAGISDLFENVWKLQPERSWEYWRELEAKGWVKGFLSCYDQELRKRQEIRQGLRQLQSIDDMLPAPIMGLFDELFGRFCAHAESYEAAGKRLSEFLASDEILNLPFVQIQSALYATIAKKAASQVRLPTQGFSVDVDAMSCLLPYCDAMFMDREVVGLWRDIQSSQSRRLPYDTKLFSMVSKSEFLSYLDGLEQAVPDKQRRYSDEVLG